MKNSKSKGSSSQPLVQLEKDVCADLARSIRYEWLETNGIGGYASSTVSTIHTRRYHGLLIGATDPPVKRMVMLSKFEESVNTGDDTYDLTANEYPGVTHPKGFENLVGFRLDPFPVWTYQLGNLTLERRLFMVHGENTTVFNWQVVGSGDDPVEAEIDLRPLLAMRSIHSLVEDHELFRYSYEFDLKGASVKTKKSPEVRFFGSGFKVGGVDKWYHDFQYRVERERGFDSSEDLYQPYFFKFDLKKPAWLIVAQGEPASTDGPALMKAEIERRSELSDGKGSVVSVLRNAADQFIVSRGDGSTVIAGYPWFTDWGRDTMISLNGLTAATGRLDIARSIILEFSSHISRGMLPNRFPDEGKQPEYNTVDAALWYFEAIRGYVENTGDLELLKNGLFEDLDGMIEWHVKGTRYGIGVASDGLLHAGEEGVQLTWMDAKIDDWVVTPRTGKPVEIQALWYNALCVMRSFAKQIGKDEKASHYRQLAASARKAFNEKFWNEDQKCLFDVVSDDGSDASVRPNQIFAVSLPNPILEESRFADVVNKVEQELLTPYGLRSLAPGDPDYRPRYEGGPSDRDSAYHQGTVWTWLIGPYIDAYRKVHGNSDDIERRVEGILKDLTTFVKDRGVGQLAEIFDAEPPHHPRGCYAQAWSVAEVLRAVSGLAGSSDGGGD